MSLPLNTRAATSPLTSLSTPVSELPQAQVDAIIRTKRKAREPKACYPCHTRKVKCDRNLPCDGCVKRDHADLCSYERPSKKRHVTAAQVYGATNNGGDTGSAQVNPAELQIGTAGAAGKVSIPKEEWDSVCTKLKDMESMITSLRMGFEQVELGLAMPSAIPSASSAGRSGDSFPDREGIHASNELGNGTVHLGSRSVIAYLLGRSGTSQEASQALLEGGILPKLGLDNESATYPFVDLWSTDISTFDMRAVCAVLPDEDQCRMFVQRYRDIGATIYPVIPDIEQFEANLDTLLQNRAMWGGLHPESSDETDKPYGMSLAFIGLLFAALAAGCQSSDLPSKERELTSQVYVCCSYQFLRMTNFLSQPTLEAIQTLLIIGNVLSYNMNPGVSYVLLGMTLRMGLALGLHVESNRFSSAERYIRRRVWWSMAWQDSHFSLSYDRPSTMAFSQPDIPYHVNSQPGNRSYFETLSRIISLTMEILKGRMLSPHSQMGVPVIQAYKDELQRIMADGAPHLRDPQYCLSPFDHLERLGLKLHSSYITSELCRPALKNAESKEPCWVVMRKDCVAALARTIEAYTELCSLSSQAGRSWIGLQRAISSAFLLAVIGESKNDPHILQLLRRLESVIAERASSEGAFNAPPTTAAGPGTSGAGVPSPQQPYRPTKIEQSDVINGITNISTPSYDPISVSIASTATVPVSLAADTQTQWAKPLIKSLRALQKLNAAFSTQPQHKRSPSAGPPHLVIHGGASTNSTGSTAMHTPSSTSTPNMSGGFPASSIGSGAAGLTLTTKPDSLPPHTPESTTSGEWTLPNLMDRAAEYIHPPLWA
ncbi:hypothetical protein AJ78_06130 [Emergomyces pasteurianus Ep9510]|uniref:Zn(2)-C6 fungal-type domain-containing protein n=1 Tax=Emergomyces pasteurianus Ep9510 TaxID=1447872 RepID=A0A1J9QE06_9EURO|nr:hypothetical protein AJ78_06130 [Emergomyces pasteurianus Ep9510]